MKLIAHQAARGQRGDRCRRARQRQYAQASRTYRIDDARAGIGNGRRAGIRYQCDAFAGLQTDDEFFGDFALVVLMRRNHVLRQTVVCQQMAGIAGILAGYCVH
jgi:hypothetical protein